MCEEVQPIVLRSVPLPISAALYKGKAAVGSSVAVLKEQRGALLVALQWRFWSFSPFQRATCQREDKEQEGGDHDAGPRGGVVAQRTGETQPHCYYT